MSDQDKSRTSNEEIDLLYFLRPLSDGLKSIRHFLANYFRQLYQRKWWVIAIVVLAAAVSYALRFILPKSYRTEGIFISHSLNSKFCSILINNLADHAGNKENAQLLANQLKIPVNNALSIISVEASPMSDALYLNNNDRSVSLFKINLILSENNTLKTIQAGIVSFLENNEYSLIRKQARLKSLNALNEDYLLKLKSLDSLKKLVNSSIVPRSSGQGIALSKPVNPIGVYEAEQSYYSQLLKNREQLETSDNIEILQPFMQTDTYNYPNFQRLSLIIIGVTLGLALLIIPFAGKKEIIK